MQNIRERLTRLWPATGASSRRTARFAVSISASLTTGLTTSVDMGKRIFKKITDFPRVVPHFFSRNLTCLVCDMHAPYWKILTETKLITCESPTTLDMRSRRIRHGNTQQRCLCASSICNREVFIEALSSRNFQSFSQLFGCVTKNAQTQCQCVGSKFIASKKQETHSCGNTGLQKFGLFFYKNTDFHPKIKSFHF